MGTGVGMPTTEDMEVIVFNPVCFTKDGIILKVGIEDFLAIERKFGYAPTGPPGCPTLHLQSNVERALAICLTTIIPGGDDT